MDYAGDIERLGRSRPDLAEQLRELRGLGGVMTWMSNAGLKLGDVDIAQQDEFSLDFLVPFADGRQWLAFGIT
jgi:hypothetical protein